MENEFLRFIAGIFGVEETSLSLETKKGDLPQWDSLMQLRLVGEILDEYDVDIPIDEVSTINSLGDFYKYIAG